MRIHKQLRNKIYRNMSSQSSLTVWLVWNWKVYFSTRLFRKSDQIGLRNTQWKRKRDFSSVGDYYFNNIMSARGTKLSFVSKHFASNQILGTFKYAYHLQSLLTLQSLSTTHTWRLFTWMCSTNSDELTGISSA